MTGHSAHDDAGYVPQELFEFWEKRDPIKRLEASLTGQGLMNEAKIEALDKRIVKEIDDAVAIAENDPFPDPEDCLTDVYYED